MQKVEKIVVKPTLIQVGLMSLFRLENPDIQNLLKSLLKRVFTNRQNAGVGF